MKNKNKYIIKDKKTDFEDFVEYKNFVKSYFKTNVIKIDVDGYDCAFFSIDLFKKSIDYLNERYKINKIVVYKNILKKRNLNILIYLDKKIDFEDYFLIRTLFDDKKRVKFDFIRSIIKNSYKDLIFTNKYVIDYENKRTYLSIKKKIEFNKIEDFKKYLTSVLKD